MAPFLYDCPVTSQKVQGWLSYDPFAQDEAAYETVTCLACRGTHLINPKTGKAAAHAASQSELRAVLERGTEMRGLQAKD